MSSVRYQSASPCRLLQPCVARYWQIETEGPLSDATGRWALPDGGSEWFFVLADPLVRDAEIHRAGAYAAGTALAAYASKPAGRMLTFGITFKPGGAAAFSRLPANELAGLVVPLETLWGSTGAGVAERLWEAPGFRTRVQQIEQELLACHRGIDVEVAEAVQQLTADPSMAIGSLTGDSASARRLERKFRALVGIGPKHLARMLRLQHATRMWAAGKASGWAALAAAAGFSDQAHMIREFRALAGTSPRGFVERERPTSDSFKTGDRRPSSLGQRSSVESILDPSR